MASRGINKVIIVGKLGQDPEIRYTQAGKAIASLSVATSDSWKDQGGQIQERTEWHRVSMFGKLAEVAGEYLRKGSQVYIEGKLQTRKWQDKSGQDRYTTEIIVDGFDGKMQMLGSRSGQSEGGSQPQPQRQTAPTQQQQQKYQQPAQDQGGFNQNPQQQNQTQPMGEPDFDDDIPF